MRNMPNYSRGVLIIEVLLYYVCGVASTNKFVCIAWETKV